MKNLLVTLMFCMVLLGCASARAVGPYIDVSWLVKNSDIIGKGTVLNGKCIAIVNETCVDFEYLVAMNGNQINSFRNHLVRAVEGLSIGGQYWFFLHKESSQFFTLRSSFQIIKVSSADKLGAWTFNDWLGVPENVNLDGINGVVSLEKSRCYVDEQKIGGVYFNCAYIRLIRAEDFAAQLLSLKQHESARDHLNNLR